MTARARRPIWLAALAVVGATIATYITAFQVGAIHHVWDPLFGNGSERVLTSAVARLLPVPDASLGAAAYIVDALLALGLIAGVGRPRAVRGALATIASLGALASIVLVVLQPVMAGAFCSLCMASAAISVALAVGAITEARSTLEEVHR